MKGTIKKGGRVLSGDVTKSFIVTESGIVETEEVIDNPKPRRESLRTKQPTTERRQSLFPVRPGSGSETPRQQEMNQTSIISSEDTELMFKDYHKTQRKKAIMTRMTFDDAKSKLESLKYGQSRMCITKKHDFNFDLQIFKCSTNTFGEIVKSVPLCYKHL